MRSLVALAALALSGTANLAAASVCRPKNPTSTLASNLASTSTATGSEPTQTGALPKVRNLASNGNMGEIDPDDPTAFPDWDVEGECKIVGGQGRQEPGSNERGAAAMSASNTGSGKRDMGISVSISQTIANLDLTTPYTIRFYYLVVTSPQAINLCELTAYLGGAVFHQSWVFSQGTAISWNEVLKSVQPAQVNAPLRIGMNCLLGGGATILVDSVFISNLVTPETINDFVIDFGNSGTGENPPLTPPAVGPTSAVPGESTSFPASAEQGTSTWLTSGEEETATPTWFTTGPGEQESSLFTSGPAEQETSWFTSGSEEASTWATSAPEETSTWYTSGAEEHSTWYTSGSEEEEHSTWYTSGVEEHSTWYTSSPEQEVSTWYTTGVEEASTWYTTTPEQQQTSEPESQFTTAWTEPGTQSSSVLPDTTSSAPPTFCSKALNGGCWWKRPWSGDDMVNCASRGSWPGSDGQGWEVTDHPDSWGTPWSQLWCLGWCSLTPGCKSVAWMPDSRTCRFSKFEVQDSTFVHGPNPNVDTPGVFYWHDLSCFNCPCNDEDEVTSVPEIPSTAVTLEPESTQVEPETPTQAQPETTTQAEPTSEPANTFKLPPASTCPKALKDGCKWTNQNIGHAFCAYRGTWPADDAAGWAVSPPADYPMALSQMWCVAWCSLDPRCKSAAYMSDRSCRFSTHEVQDDDFIMAANPNVDNPEEGIYYWHDLSCMTCACHDDPTTTTLITTTTQPSLPGGQEETWIWLTPTPEPPVEEQACEWDWGQGICYRPFEKEQGPCGGSLKIVNPAQYTKLPYDWVPQVSEPVHCAILCHTNPDCGAWGFEWSMNMNCVLSLNKRSVDELEVVSSGAEWRWYDRDCWVCKDCVTSWDWTWGSQPSTALPSEAYTTTYPTTTEEPVYTTTTAQPAETTCPTLDEPIKLCQRTGHTGNCEGKVDWVNPTNYYKASMDRFPEQKDAADALTCAAICKANPDCRAFGWYPDIECVIAYDQKTMDDLEWGVRSPQWYLWFNLDCFECDETCVAGQYAWSLEAAEETQPALNPTVLQV